jgi:putative spermidine/putrescine transport system substrate-binding protein
MTHELTRRSMMKTAALAAGAAIGGQSLLRPAFAAAELVAATYPGAFEESYRKVLLPLVKQETGAQITLTPVLALDQVAKVAASRASTCCCSTKAR